MSMVNQGATTNIKSIQHVTGTVAANAGSTSITITAIDTTKYMLIHKGPNDQTSATGISTVQFTLASATSITMAVDGVGTDTIKGAVDVVEFILSQPQHNSIPQPAFSRERFNPQPPPRHRVG